MDDEDGDASDLRRRTFLERHDWIPWILGTAIVCGLAGFFFGR